MKNSQLVHVFLALDGKEKRAINKVVGSPFFNQRQEVIDLWRYLVEHANEGSAAFRKESIFESVFPGKVYDDKLLRHVSSWLLQNIEEYLAYVEYKRTPVIETLYKAKAYKNKKLGKQFQKTISAAEGQLKSIPHSPDFFHMDYQIEFEKFTFAETRKLVNEDYLRHINASLDKYVFFTKLKQACIVRAHQSVFTTKYNFQFVEHLITYLKDSPYFEEPGIACYYYCYKAVSENDEECFQKLKDLLQKNKKILAQDDVEYLYFSAINFSIKMLNTKGGKYRRETFELYKTGIKDKILIRDGEFSRFAFNNIVTTALPLNELEWLEDFINTYKSLINPRYRESNFSYNLAKIKIAKKEYNEAMGLLLKVDDKDILVNLDAKVLLLKIYYEKNEFDALTSLLSSFGVMLSRNKVVGYHKEHFQNIIRFTNRLLNLPSGDKAAREKLRQDILQAEVLGQREWLLEQLK
jgi:hypothetical protein